MAASSQRRTGVQAEQGIINWERRYLHYQQRHKIILTHNHWNPIHVLLDTKEKLDMDHLEKAAGNLLLHHMLWRLRYGTFIYMAVWKQLRMRNRRTMDAYSFI
ncbi:hypothetical protein CW304_30640 [Bacillus sp. UFRGS-B20]|nr:hypothetical protein CW304_30640 [Bacillus sp. UFRGS-B20]